MFSVVINCASHFLIVSEDNFLWNLLNESLGEREGSGWGCLYALTQHACWSNNFFSLYYYSEENVWFLCNTVQNKHPDDIHGCFCIFISNERRAVCMLYI